MILETLDWIIIASFLLLSLYIGLKYKNQGSSSLDSFFLGGRNLPWYIAGMSMVATTFAADTPLAVTELVAKNGISSNWIWWNFLIGGMLTTFFFANLWRRANVLTELELIELRYSGIPAAILRGFKSIYLGLFMNVLIIGWVNLAMVSIIQVFFDVPPAIAFWYMVGVMIIAMAYSSLSGLLGVAITDTIQFVIAMVGCIILAVIVVNSDKIGGIAALKTKLPEGSLNFLPEIGGSSGSGLSTLSISIGAFFSFATIQWWASWYPGAEPGGGGYIAQRMMSTKNEKDAVFATLFFQIAHYCIRPWPWILVGLCSIVLYPDLTDKKLGFVMTMKDFLPVGLKGLLFVAFLAAYMSTISTQLNWGASYLVNDLYKRFIKKSNQAISSEKEEKHYVLVSKLTTILIMIIGAFVTTQINSIAAVWEFIMECGAGLGLVLILRWYWWRINAWSEIVATLAPFVGYIIGHYFLTDYFGTSFVENRGPFIFTVLFTTLAWILATFLTKPSEHKTLLGFYNLVRPDGNWKPFKTDKKDNSNLVKLIICWISSISLTYSLLFFTGKFILQEYMASLYFLISAMISFLILRYFLIRTNIFNN
jgi:SSS family solute:Na+ symporter